MISLIHPSRGRPVKSAETIQKWIKNWMGVLSYEIKISVDEDDKELPFYKEIYGEQLIISKNTSAVDAINNGAKKASGSILIVVSDDSDCPPEWDAKLIHTVKLSKDWILKTQDGTQPWIITMPIMDRAYYNRFGYIYYPEYKHMFCDTELTCVADITGRKITSDLLFKHNHYSVTKTAPDEVSRRADKTWDQGEKLFLERYKRNFDLPPGGRIQDNGMISWLQRKVK